MPSKIEEIFSVSHDVDSKLNENKGMVKMLDQKAAGIQDGCFVNCICFVLFVCLFVFFFACL
jgi:hypothetical protein